MASKKESEPPKLATIIILAVLSLALGKVLAFVSLATQTVTEVNSMPDEKDRHAGMVYFVKGSESSSPGWGVKRKNLLEGKKGTVAFGENDLNQWSRGELKANTPAEEDAGLFDVEASAINFRLFDDKIQIGTRVELPKLVKGKQFIVQYQGHFETTANGPNFVIDKGSFGRAPIGQIPVLRELLGKLIFSSFLNSDEFKSLESVLESTDEILVENGRIGFVKS